MSSSDEKSLYQKIKEQLDASNVFDLPSGRHESIISEFYRINGNNDSDHIDKKLQFIWSNLHKFNDFMGTQERYNSNRLNVERQAKLEPERTEAAINALNDLGIDVTVISKTEINFTYKGSVVRYFPYSGWASGKTIKDGRGFKNLLNQLV